jgi:arylsulfatase A-like enzyme
MHGSPPRPFRFASAPLALLSAVTLVGCGDPTPDWIALESVQGTSYNRAEAERVETSQTLAPDAWATTPVPGLWITTLDIEGSNLANADLMPHALRTISSATPRELTLVPWTPALLAQGDFQPGTFTVVAGDLFLFDPDDAFHTEPMRYTATIGMAAPDRFVMGPTTSSGWLLGPRESVTVPLPAIDEPVDLFLSVWAYGNAKSSNSAAWVVRADGKELYRDVLNPTLVGKLDGKRLALDLQGVKQLTFENPNERSALAIGSPRLVRRAWHTAQAENPDRRDLVLYIIDTFRADNLAVNGGDPRWTPHLNKWAQSGLVYTQARATSPWTLPSHATMLTGMYPAQHGAISQKVGISHDLLTVAEQMRAAGYRTVAITDGLYVSTLYGLDQGFEFFYEHDIGMDYGDTTLPSIKQLLAQDDGRPLFLFVQTYNVHTPYQVLPETIARFPELFDPEVPTSTWFWPYFQTRVDTARGATDTNPAPADPLLNTQLHSMYRGNVIDFDASFEATLSAFKEAGMDNTVWVLTSDHGEAFGEHGELFHSHSVFEEEVHVPLILHGPGIPAEVRAQAVSLIDLAPTLTDLANIPSGQDWTGRSWLAPAGPSTPFGSFANDNPGESDVVPFAVYLDAQKVIGELKAGELQPEAYRAFDLPKDPKEQAPRELTAQDAALRARIDALLVPWLNPFAASRTLELSEMFALKLDAMGYVEKARQEMGKAAEK